MIDDALAIFIALIVLGVGFIRRPRAARCQAGEYVEGVRPSGSTWCVRAPSGPEIDCRGTRRCFPNETPRYTTPIKIYCTGGQIPIVVDDRMVACQARH